MVLWVFDGNMVGKWTNEPCNGVDEVVNSFSVLTLMSHISRMNESHDPGRPFKVVITTSTFSTSSSTTSGCF